MSFDAPAALLLLLIIPVGVALYVMVQRRRQRYAARFTNLDLLANVVDESPGWKRHVPAALYALALAVLLLALARPQTTRSVPKEQATIMLVTDISGSMNATDVQPTRLGAAQTSALQLLDELPKSFRVGLISFSNSVNTLVPPTTDRDAVKSALLHLKPNGGTAMGDAIETALDDLKAANEPPQPDATIAGAGNASPTPTPTPTPAPVDANGNPIKPTNVIVLLSDGANTLGRTDPLDAANDAKDQNVPIYTIALGTADGVAEVTDQAGRIRRVPVPPDPQTLQTISQTTNGQSFEAPSSQQLQAIYKDIGSKLAHENKDEEITFVFAGIGAAFLVLAAGLSLAWFNRFP
jgi:Ca-activated chloride channel family protein